MKRATELAHEAWKYAEDGRLEEAIQLHRKALQLAQPDDDLWQIHGQLATLFAKSGDLQSAREEYELAVQSAMSRSQSDAATVLAITRYFLATTLLQLGDAAKAIEVITPSLGQSRTAESGLRTAQAKAYELMGDIPAAREAAERAVATSETEDQRDRVVKELGHLLRT